MAQDMPNAHGSASQHVISFGPFRLFVAERLLERCIPVHLGRRAAGILAALAERPTEVVSKEDLLARVWPDRTIKEESLRFHVAALRKALGNGRSGIRYLANIPGRGYRFIAPTSHATLTPSENVAPAPIAQLDYENSHLGLTSPAPPRSSRPFDEQRLRQVFEFVEGNLGAHIRVADLASVARLSQFHFSRAFRRATGQTPHHFVRARRLEKAKELLVTGDATLLEIALSCGFSSQASFTRAFSRAAGLSPAEYRVVTDKRAIASWE
jgi:AraC-like DNA-binding protein